MEESNHLTIVQTKESIMSVFWALAVEQWLAQNTHDQEVMGSFQADTNLFQMSCHLNMYYDVDAIKKIVQKIRPSSANKL